MGVWRWQHDTVPAAPEGNMVLDAALLAALRDSATALPTIRVYTWDRACVTMGRGQNEAEVQAAFPGLPLVRRPTGGRAVLHGDDLTITVAARLSDLPPGTGTGILATYQQIAAPIADAFRALGIPAEFGSESSPSAASSPDCFASAARCDLIDPRTVRKLAGCAQRRSGTILLQQMSVPLAPIPDPVSFVAQFRSFAAVRWMVMTWDGNEMARTPSVVNSTLMGLHYADEYDPTLRTVDQAPDCR